MSEPLTLVYVRQAPGSAHVVLLEGVAAAAWQGLVMKGVDAQTVEALEVFAEEEGVQLDYV